MRGFPDDGSCFVHDEDLAPSFLNDGLRTFSPLVL